MLLQQLPSAISCLCGAPPTLPGPHTPALLPTRRPVPAESLHAYHSLCSSAALSGQEHTGQQLSGNNHSTRGPALLRGTGRDRTLAGSGDLFGRAFTTLLGEGRHVGKEMVDIWEEEGEGTGPQRTQVWMRPAPGFSNCLCLIRTFG